jgi:hypothetical protein
MTPNAARALHGPGREARPPRRDAHGRASARGIRHGARQLARGGQRRRSECVASA